MVVVRAVGGEGGGYGLSEYDGSLLPLVHDDLCGGLAHHMHHVQGALHLVGQNARPQHRLSLDLKSSKFCTLEHFRIREGRSTIA